MKKRSLLRQNILAKRYRFRDQKQRKSIFGVQERGWKSAKINSLQSCGFKIVRISLAQAIICMEQFYQGNLVYRVHD